MKKLITLSIVMFGLFACQKVIDVDLNDASPQLVIEANYIASDSLVSVRVTKTSSYFDTNPSPEVNTAIVTLYDQNGTPTIIPSVGNGEYELSGYIPTYNSNYTLTVSTEGTTYTAICHLASPVPLEPIVEQYFPPGLFSGDGGYVILVRYNDPVDTSNFFEIIQGKNGIFKDSLSSILTQDDALTDGNFVERPLFNIIYQSGDVANIELRSVDESIYDYVQQAQSTNDPSSAAPGNPSSNWNNSALGYFSAYSYSRQSLLIP